MNEKEYMKILHDNEIFDKNRDMAKSDKHFNF